MADTAKVIRNITKLISAGAKEKDITEYMSSENITPQQLGAKDDGAFKAQLSASIQQAGFQKGLAEKSVLPGKAGEAVTAVGQALPSEETVSKVGGAIADIGKEAALPTVLGIVGGAAGGALALTNPATAPFAGAAALSGESAGSLVGEGLNQLFGVTERSNTQLLLAAGIPAIAKGVSKLGVGAVKRFSGASRELQEEAIETLAGRSKLEELATNPLPLDFKPDPGSIIANIVPEGSVSSKALFSRLEKLNPPIKARNSKVALIRLKREIGKVDPALQDTGLSKIVESLDDLLSKGDLDFQSVQANLKALKGKLGADRNVNRQINSIIGGFNKDLDRAGGKLAGEAGKTLREANKAFALERFQENVAEVASNFIKRGKGLDDPVQINLASIIENVRKGAKFKLSRKAVRPELDDLIKTVSALSRATPAKVTKSKDFQNLIIGSTVGGLVTLGGSPVLGGAIATANVLVPFITAKFLATKVGRKLLRSAIKDGPLTGKSLMASLQVIRNTEAGQFLTRQVEDITSDAQKQLDNSQPAPEPAASAAP